MDRVGTIHFPHGAPVLSNSLKRFKLRPSQVLHRGVPPFSRPVEASTSFGSGLQSPKIIQPVNSAFLSTQFFLFIAFISFFCRILAAGAKMIEDLAFLCAIFFSMRLGRRFWACEGVAVVEFRLPLSISVSSHFSQHAKCAGRTGCIYHLGPFHVISRHLHYPISYQWDQRPFYGLEQRRVLLQVPEASQTVAPFLRLTLVRKQ